eukprot:GHVO01039801.1.p3 GENE.GHVO01039801.1~~GHVO01039801.1.p3  ORF type:complete len:109 (+),score=17.58 GHVO01039801.1:3-329(+)
MAPKRPPAQAPVTKVQPKSVLDFSKLLNQKVHVKLSGGREVVGHLKGSDPVCNLILDDSEEYLRDDKCMSDKTRSLGLIMVRGTAVMVIYGVDGSARIDNPFLVTENE